jgi:diadenosine tetraphosphate (Ap4A) HIT family hydrolase
MSLDRLWASWRSAYVADVTLGRGHESGCVFCALLREEPSPESGLIVANELAACLLNAYPYGSGHLLVLPRRHVAGLSELTDDEAAALWALSRQAVRSVEQAYRPDGVNLGANLGEAAGAGIPAHLHLHVLPRWQGDTNFMTSIAETRVLPESLAETWVKVTAAWPEAL